MKTAKQPPEYGDPELIKLTARELKQICVDEEIPVHANAPKREMVQAITSMRRAQSDWDAIVYGGKS